MPVSRTATWTRGSPIERFHARSALTPGICPSGLRRAAAFCACCLAVSCGFLYVAVSCVPNGANPKRSYCSLKTLLHVEPPSLSGSHGSKPGSSGVFALTDSSGSLPGKFGLAASASAGATASSRTTRMSTLRFTAARRLSAHATSCAGRRPRLGSAAPERRETAMRQTGPDPSHIMQVGMGFWASKTVLLAVELALFTELGDESLTGGELGERLGLHERAIYDFLDTLVALRLLERDGDGSAGRYRNSADTATFLDKR